MLYEQNVEINVRKSTGHHGKTQVGLNWKYPISELIKLRFTR